jgi:hypothetical protein
MQVQQQLRVPLPMFHLTQIYLDEKLTLFTKMITTHRQKTSQQLEQLGFLIPSATFFQRELMRYVSILKHSHSQYLVSAREVVQNSSDAGTNVLYIDGLDLTSGHSNCNMLKDLQAFPRFVRFSDAGRWCPEGSFDTYDKCVKYFLRMNGSSKDGVLGDGGFGVGRFVIIFCAPLWFFTTRHLLVMGHFNMFLVVCRRCFIEIRGAECQTCGLHERDTLPGTTFAVNYGDLHIPDYFETLNLDYLQFCKSAFPIFLNQKPIQLAKTVKTIFQGEWFTVHKTDVKEEYCAVYIIRTSTGIPMFSRQLHNKNSEKGYFLVDLVASVNYTNFDQARQSLVNGPGIALEEFFSKQDGIWATHDLKQEHKEKIQGTSMYQRLYPPAATSSSSSSSSRANSPPPRERDDYTSPTSPSYCPCCVERHCVCGEVPEEKLKQHEGPVQCLYYFRNGKTMENIDEMWKPGKSLEQVYMLLAWTAALREVLTSHPDCPIEANDFQVGFVFDKSTTAMVQNKNFYINPELLFTKLGHLKKSNRHKFIAYVIARALHEVSHLQCSGHDTAYASELTENISDFLAQELTKPHILKMDIRIRKISRQIFAEYQRKHRQVVVTEPPSKKAKVVKVAFRPPTPPRRRAATSVEPPSSLEIIEILTESESSEDDDDSADEDWVVPKHVEKQVKNLGKRPRE